MLFANQRLVIYSAAGSPTNKEHFTTRSNLLHMNIRSAGLLGDLPFPPPLHFGAAPYSLQSPSSALKSSLLRAAQISSLHKRNCATYSSTLMRNILIFFAFSQDPDQAWRHARDSAALSLRISLNDDNTAAVCRTLGQALFVTVLEMTLICLPPRSSDLNVMERICDRQQHCWERHRNFTTDSPSCAGMKGQGEMVYPEKTRRPAASSTYAEIQQRPHREWDQVLQGGRRVVYPPYHRGPKTEQVALINRNGEGEIMGNRKQGGQTRIRFHDLPDATPKVYQSASSLGRVVTAEKQVSDKDYTVTRIMHAIATMVKVMACVQCSCRAALSNNKMIGPQLMVPQVHAARREHYTPVQSLALSGNGALEVPGSDPRFSDPNTGKMSSRRVTREPAGQSPSGLRRRAAHRNNPASSLRRSYHLRIGHRFDSLHETRYLLRLANSPPTKANRNRTGLCSRSAGFLGDLQFHPTFHSGTAPYSPQSPKSALKISLLRAARISSLTHSSRYLRETKIGVSRYYPVVLTVRQPRTLAVHDQLELASAQWGDARYGPNCIGMGYVIAGYMRRRRIGMILQMERVIVLVDKLSLLVIGGGGEWLTCFPHIDVGKPRAHVGDVMAVSLRSCSAHSSLPYRHHRPSADLPDDVGVTNQVRGRGGVMARLLASTLRRTGYDSRRGRPRILACGNLAGRCRRSAGFLGDLPSPPRFHFGAAPYLLRLTLIGSRDLDVKSRPNLFTHSPC
ncbi:hypothetical protein PR048_017524 [Dryococelus australis]|uniref:Uncharacterized protein n=1 Tax=Dryococelus australis TaxID=614101 RepID=A0ABQ9H9X6_9NEOP|nr:hypothetical protein PR048_017524 [Dryococelus australis]